MRFQKQNIIMAAVALLLVMFMLTAALRSNGEAVSSGKEEKRYEAESEAEDTTESKIKNTTEDTTENTTENITESIIYTKIPQNMNDKSNEHQSSSDKVADQEANAEEAADGKQATIRVTNQKTSSDGQTDSDPTDRIDAQCDNAQLPVVPIEQKEDQITSGGENQAEPNSDTHKSAQQDDSLKQEDNTQQENSTQQENNTQQEDITQQEHTDEGTDRIELPFVPAS